MVKIGGINFRLEVVDIRKSNKKIRGIILLEALLALAILTVSIESFSAFQVRLLKSNQTALAKVAFTRKVAMEVAYYAKYQVMRPNDFVQLNPNNGLSLQAKEKEHLLEIEMY